MYSRLCCYRTALPYCSLATAFILCCVLSSGTRAETPLHTETSPASPQEQPNIILIMADDVSWEAFGCYGADDYKTPRLDELAERGMRFSHCYSTPICTTSRVQIMTGKYNFRNYTHFGYLDPAQKTFGNLLQSAGYKTAIAGKWQLNGLSNSLPRYQDNTRPYDAGFDEYMLWQLTKGKGQNQGGGERFWSPLLEHNGEMLTIEQNEGKYGPDMLCDFVCDFITRSDQSPFFVYYPMVLVHDPFVPTPDTIGERDRGHSTNKPVKGKAKENFVAMVQYMDKIVGRIVDHVDSVGKLDNTLILFTADNGTNRSITSSWMGSDIRGGKATLTDMGTHVPLIAYWKGKTAVGQVNGELVDFTDFYPTLAQAAGLSLGENDPSDGQSFLPQLKGESGESRDWVFCHYQPYWNQQPGQFARTQTYKVYRDGRIYNVPDDLKEINALSLSELPEAARGEVAMLSQLLNTSPPAPVGKGDRNTKERPIYPEWKNLKDR